MNMTNAHAQDFKPNDTLPLPILKTFVPRLSNVLGRISHYVKHTLQTTNRTGLHNVFTEAPYSAMRTCPKRNHGGQSLCSLTQLTPPPQKTVCQANVSRRRISGNPTLLQQYSVLKSTVPVAQYAHVQYVPSVVVTNRQNLPPFDTS